MIYGLFGTAAGVALIATSVAPLVVADWRNAPHIAWLAAFAVAGAVLFALFGAPPVEGTFIVTFGWATAAVLAALSRIQGLVAVALARHISPALDPTAANRL